MERKSSVSCFCFDAHLGLRILGWSWLLMAFYGFYLLSQPAMMAAAIVTLTTYFPVFVAFTWMRCDDRTIQRKTLFDIYLVVGMCVGLPLMFLSYVYLYYRWDKFSDAYCTDNVDYASCIDNLADYQSVMLWYGAIATVIMGLIRGYFLSVMYKYWKEAEDAENKVDECNEHTPLINEE